MKTWQAVAVLVAAAVPLSLALAQHDHRQRAPAAAKVAQVVDIAVTDEGFTPSEVKVKAGQPVKLRVTRKVDTTCARDLVIKDLGINKPLPLGVVVEVDFTPPKGTTRFACAMNMISGTVVAE